MKVNIKGKPYKVDFKKDTFTAEGRAVDGLVDYRKKEITIATINEDELPKIVYHELLHGFFHECGLECYAHDEILVDWIANNIQEINECALKIMQRIKAVGNE